MRLDLRTKEGNYPDFNCPCSDIPGPSAVPSLSVTIIIAHPVLQHKLAVAYIMDLYGKDRDVP